MTTTYTLTRTQGPGTEPVTLAEARDQCEIAASDSNHDVKLTRYTQAAREQVEHDTGYALITQTYTLYLPEFPGDDEIILPVRPIQSVSSITYYDPADAQQTLATTVYGLDTGRRAVYLKNEQEWPDTNDQWNGIAVTFVAGYGAASNIPATLRQAVLCKVAEQFTDRGDGDGQVNPWSTAYERIVRKVANPHYP